MELFLLLLINSLYIVGFHKACDYEYDVHLKPINKMAMWWLPYYTKWLPQFIKTPLYDCMKCMSSIHGFYFFWFFKEFSFTLENVIIYIFYTFALTGLNTIINEKYLIR